MNKENQTERGKIVNLQHSFGFIQHTDYPSNLFFHSSNCDNFRSLNVQDEVTFTVTQNKKGEAVAENVKKGKN